MRTLMQLKLESDAVRTQAHALKTKAARIKRFDKARAIEHEAWDVMRELFQVGQTLTIERSINCTTPAGGGWGLNAGAQVEVLDVYSTQLVVSCNDTVFYLYMLGYESRGWCSNNIFAFTEYIASKGQPDVRLAEAKDSLEFCTKSLRGAYRCRHASGLKDSESFKARLKKQIEWAREAKLKLFKLNVDAITFEDVQNFRGAR